MRRRLHEQREQLPFPCGLIRDTSKIGNQAEFEMVPEPETMFFFRSGEAEVEFIRDPATHLIKGLIVHQDGAAFEGTRVNP